MSDDNALSTLDDNNIIAQVSNEELSLLKDMAPQTSYLPYIQLTQALSGLCSGRDAKFKAGQLIMTENQDHIDLGESFSFICCALRMKALEILPGDVTYSFFDINGENFKRVRAKAQEEGMNGALYGPEFLLYLTELDKYATFYFSSKTLQGSIDQMVGLFQQKKHGRCTPRYIEGKKHSWWGINLAVNPVSPQHMFDNEDLVSKIEKFKNAKDSEIELVETKEGKSDETDRVR